MATPATYEQYEPITLEAGTAITKYRFVKVASDGQADHVGTADTVMPDAVSIESQATVGKTFPAAPMRGGCKVKVEASAAIVVGADVSSTNTGKAVTSTNTTNYKVCGTALTAAGADGDVIEVLLKPHTLAP